MVLGLEEGLGECATVCVKSVVILRFVRKVANGGIRSQIFNKLKGQIEEKKVLLNA